MLYASKRQEKPCFHAAGCPAFSAQASRGLTAKPPEPPRSAFACRRRHRIQKPRRADYQKPQSAPYKAALQPLSPAVLTNRAHFLEPRKSKVWRFLRHMTTKAKFYRGKRRCPARSLQWETALRQPPANAFPSACGDNRYPGGRRREYQNAPANCLSSG